MGAAAMNAIMVTQRHIAELAGVDRSTVSCVLRGTGSIRPEVRTKILDITRQLGYVTNANAATLRTSESNLIGVVSATPGNPYHALLIQQLAGELESHGYRIMLALCRGNESEQRRSILELLDQRAAGVIACSSHPGLVGNMRRLLSRRLPMVIVGTVPDGPSVSHDAREGGALAGRHLIEIGRRRLVYVGDSTEHEGSGKTGGFLETVEPAAQWCRALPSTLNRRIDAGELWSWPWARELLSEFPDADAVFTGSDVIAAILVNRLQELGVRVPQDIAVIGYDDIPIARHTAVPLTTIRQPIAAYARVAVELIMNQLRNGSGGDECHRFPCKLVVRRSTNPDWVPTEDAGSFNSFDTRRSS